MKRLLLAFVFSVAYLVVGSAQHDFEGTFKSNALKLSPFEFGGAQFEMAYERYFNNRSSSLSFYPSVYLKDNQQEKIEGWQLMGQYRFYLTHLNKENQRNFLGMYNFGFYTGVYGLFQDYNEDFIRGYWDPITNQHENRMYQTELTGIEGGALIGVQIDITQRIVMDFFIGGGVRYTDYTNTYEEQQGANDYFEYGVFDKEYQGVKPKVGFQLGITF